MKQQLKALQDFIQQNQQLSLQEKEALLKSVKEADKEFTITEFKLDRTEKVKRTTAILLEETIEELEQKRKAVEAQNRELEIEAALEKVRSRSLAVHKSDEFNEVIKVVFERLQELKIPMASASINVIIEGSKDTEAYICGSGEDGLTLSHIRLVHFDHPIANDRYDAYEKGLDFFTKTYSAEEKNSFYEYEFAVSDLKYIPADIKKMVMESERYTCSLAFTKNSMIVVNDFEGKSLSPEEIDIVKRFAKVFEQAYVRFLDLQKAEAQAREAEIELALERVRARTMAMRQQDELIDVITLLADQLVQLGIDLDVANFSNGLSDKDWDLWLYTNKALPGNRTRRVFCPWIDHPYFHEVKAAIANFKKGIDLSVAVFNKGDKDSFLDHVFTNTTYKDDYADLPDSIREFLYNSPGYTWSTIITKDTWVSICRYDVKPFTDKQNAILRRFTNAFGQAYTRFLDLQKAEVQAREAQIEAGLERVRSRSMAMHITSELQEVIHTVHKEFIHLNIASNGGSFIAINNDITTNLRLWGSGGTADTSEEVHLPRYEKPFCTHLLNRIKSGPGFFTEDYTHKEKKEFFTFLFKHEPWSKLAAKLKKETLSSPGGYTRSCCVSQHTSIFIINHFGEKFSDADNDILKRFAKVFEQTYTRFLDLQKAEAQAREAKIEAALEKVRSRSLAMHKADELGEVVLVIVEKIKELNIEMNGGVTLVTFVPGSKDFLEWHSNPGQIGETLTGLLSYFNHPVFNDCIEAVEQGVELLVKVYPKEEKDSYIDYLAAHTDYIPGDMVQWIHEQEHMGFSFAIQKHSGIFLQDFTGKFFSKEENDILIRFSRVFEQSYIRFLDLQKAEAQAREAQIEAALERVRSRSMGMQKSEELKEVIKIVYQQLTHLKIKLDHSGFVVDYTPKGDWHFWIADEQDIPSKITHPYFESVWATQFNEAKEKGADFFATNLNFEEKNRFYNELLSYVPGLPEASKDFYLSCPGLAASTVLFDNVSLYIENFSGIPYSDEENKILMRFGKVFQQTYTRFLDLQKAEAQAREAQVEAALERVRSKAMAMQKSEDLANAVAIVFEELDKLDLGMLRCGIGIINKGNRSVNVWASTKSEKDMPVQVSGDESMDIHPLLQGAFNAWLKQEEYSYELRGEDLTDYYKTQVSANFKLPGSHSLVTANEDVQQYYFLATFPAGGLFAFRDTAFPEEAKVVMKRFADVFNLTYTRYNDLQLAEAQTREAKIEATLERVRGKAMAMHNSNDLIATASMVFTELRKLGINPVRCGVSLQTKESRKNLLYYAIPSAEGDNLSFAGTALLAGHPVLSEVYDSWIRGEDYFPVLKGDLLTNYYQTLKQVGFDVPASPKGYEQYGYYLPFSVGMFYGWAEKPFSETELKILKRFATVIDLTFRRYMELQKSEANAREAVKQAALDRVRAEIASMRTIDDLERITPLIWNELTILGVAFIRCGVFIMDDANELIHTFLSTPEGKAIAAFHLPYTTPGNIEKVLSHWQNKKNYIDHWDESAFMEFANILGKQGSLATSALYLETIPRGGFYLHFLPFLQGMLYVGNTTQLHEEEIKLIQSVADAFSTAYARYEDFNKLEAAKQQVDKTLVDLKQAQTQLVQSEKMASLGELTAGIAHEIQNPLNFVNNFSEVSNELLDEMKTELINGNNEEAIAIAENIIQNLEKINHHGKRADAIVKGMLQHSRMSSGQKELTDINVLADEYLRLSYHGLRAKDNTFNAAIKTDFDNTLEKIILVPQDIGRVILNLYNNAFYALAEKKKQNPKPPEGGKAFEPTILVSTKRIGDMVEISVSDNGNGIPQNIVDKIFQPFFTTKPTGQGTGLGLSLSYDIIKAKGGEIKVETKDGEGSTFIIKLPIS